MNYANYTLEFDTQRTGTYADAKDDVTAYVAEMDGGTLITWNNGMNAPYQEVAQPASMTVSLYNDGDLFSPDNFASTYFLEVGKGMLGRLLMNTGGADQQMFEGRLVNAVPTVSAKGRRVMQFLFVDMTEQLQKFDFVPDLRTNDRTDQSLSYLFDQNPVFYPYAKDYWLLGYSQLGINTLLPDQDLTTFDVGLTTIPYSGVLDAANSDQYISGLSYIQETVRHEAGGLFYYDVRTSKFVFLNRHFISTNLDVSATFDGSQIDTINPRWGDDLFNVLTLYYTPKSIGAAGSILWSSNSLPLTVKKDESKTVRVQWQNPDDNSTIVGATTVINPVNGLDFILSEGSVFITLDAGATGGTLTIVNTGAVDAELTTLQVRGTPLLSYNEEIIELIDVGSLAEYGREARVYRTVFQTEGLARDYAQLELSRNKDLNERIDSVNYLANRSTTLLDRAKDLTVGNVIRIDDSIGSGHDRNYAIVGEQHTLSTGRVHNVTYVLRPTSTVTVWILGDDIYSVLGVTTIPGF